MTLVTLSLAQRYKAAFGSLASSNQPNAVTVNEQTNGYNLEFYGKGNDDFEDVEFQFEDNKVTFGSIPFVTGQSATNQNIIAPPPLINFSQSKKHIETEINGSENIVVERWGTKPWSIRIRGLLIDMSEHHYPEDKIRALYQLFKYNNVVDVIGTQFFDKDIDSIYFKNFEVNGVQGFEDTIQFTLEASSIAPVGFTLLSPNL